MDNLNEKPVYIEDEFDLQDLKKRAQGLKRKNELLRKHQKMSRPLFVLSGILLLSIALSAGWMLKYSSEAKKIEQINEQASEIPYVEPVRQTDESNEEAGEPPPVRDEEEPATPLVEEKKELLVQIIDLREAFSNEDIVGYLQIDDTNIGYAVAQSADNEFYLEHDLSGKKNAAGSVFMDYECDAYNLSRNTVIYGHNMRNGSMFHNLRYFADPKYFAARRFIKLTTPYEETIWEIFSFYKTDTDFYYIQVVFPDDASFLSLVSEMKGRSLYDTGTEVGPDDKILTLSTCANTSSDARFVLNARLVRE